MQKSSIQSVVFFKQRKDGSFTKWNITIARKWLKDNNLKLLKGKKIDKVIINGNIKQLRFRILSPKKFKRFTTKVIPDDIHIILGWK